MSDQILTHPLKPFLPGNCRILMLGSFPPPPARWCIDFYYPNFNNDMWRIFGIIFFNDKNYFINSEKKIFSKNLIISFLNEQGIGIYDTAYQVKRLKDNASDAFLKIVQPTPIKEFLLNMPSCTKIITTGTLATATLASSLNVSEPEVGSFIEFSINDISRKFWRMPSSSRAYPLALDKKAIQYKKVFNI